LKLSEYKRFADRALRGLLHLSVAMGIGKLTFIVKTRTRPHIKYYFLVLEREVQKEA
jgi:hypothetical protein